MTTLLTITQAANQRGVNVSTVRRWCLTGELKATKFGKSWVIAQEDLDRFTPARRGPKVK